MPNNASNRSSASNAASMGAKRVTLVRESTVCTRFSLERAATSLESLASTAVFEAAAGS